MNVTPYVINAFIITYILFATSWSISNNCYTKQLVHKHLFKLVTYWGLWHSWNMFSSPSRNNDSLDLELIFEDNSSQTIEIFSIKNKKLFLGKRASVRDVKFCENLIYNTEFSEFSRISFLKFLMKSLNLDKKVIRAVFIKNSESMKIWNEDNIITTKKENLQTISL